VATPSPPKVMSSCPSALNRATAKTVSAGGPCSPQSACLVRPPTMIFPSAPTATSAATSSNPSALTTRRPPSPKDASGVPSEFSRMTSMSFGSTMRFEVPCSPAATIFPSGASASAVRTL
jgi:hypothetical protein